VLIYEADPVARMRYEAEGRCRAKDFAIHAGRLDAALLHATATGNR
jgi:hypothetical protein